MCWSLLTIFLACRPTALPDPVIHEVDPVFAFNGDGETVDILGANFYPQVEISAFTGAVDVDRSFSAWLEGELGGDRVRYPFAGVSIIDDGLLRANLEPGLPPGLYDLVVEGPTGHPGALDDAFTVTDVEATQLILSSDRIVYTLGEEARISIQLVDLGGEEVEVPLEVALVATSATSDQLVYTTEALGELRPTPDSDGIIGTLRGGRAEIGILPDGIGQLRVRVDPWGDSEILGDDLAVTFAPGDDWSVEITLPSDPPPPFVAGQPFTAITSLVDQYGNPVETRQNLTFVTKCSGWVGQQEILGPTELIVTPSFACNNDQILVFAGPQGASEPYTVDAGPADHFQVELPRTSYRAGELLEARIYPEDAHNNRTGWSGEVTLAASSGGLIGTTCSQPFTSYDCEATITVAGDLITISAIGDGGAITGTSAELIVTADPVPGSVEIAVGAQATAGQRTTVEIQPLDAWGNAINAAILGGAAFSISDSLGEATCDHVGYTLADAALFDCVLHTARPDAILSVEILGYGIQADSLPFEVINGALAEVVVTGEAPIEAGQPLELILSGYDLDGNPYLVQSNPQLDLFDDTHSWDLPSIDLGLDGTVAAQGVITVAGSTTLHVLQDGLEIGRSDPITVQPGPTEGLQITPQSPWGWVGDPTDVRTESIDAYGNRTDWGGLVILTSQATLSPPVDVTLVNGVGLGAFTWTEPAFTDTLSADGGGWQGHSPPLAVAQDCGASNPTVDVSFSGRPEALSCLDPFDTTTVTADLSASVQGALPLLGYAAAPVGGIATADLQPQLDVELVGAGVHELAVLVVDTAGCADEGTARAWAGPGGGLPVGPVPLSSTRSTISEFDTVAVNVVGMTDCSGDPASQQELRLWVTGGTLSGLQPTGDGLALALDANGDGTLDIDTNGEIANGTLTLTAWVPSGAAGGSLQLSLIGDNTFPTVEAQQPTGQTSGMISEIVLTFSEPLLGDSVVPANFSVTGPAAVTIDSAILEPSGDVVRLVLDTAVDAGTGAWTVVVSSDVRDMAGNRLAGDWETPATDYTGAFGDVGGTVDAVACTSITPSSGVFRPDGDPGVDSEADRITFELDSALAPAWWVIEITATDGTLVYQDWRVPLGPIDHVTWDGRDKDGYIVANGSYSVQIQPDDGLGNQGPGCELVIWVDNALEPLP